MWILEQRAEGRGLSIVQVHLKAKTVATEMNVPGFAGGPSWRFRFMRRNKLAIRAHTTVCVKLTGHFQEECENFQAFVQIEVKDHDVSASHIINMDEVLLTFDIPMDRSVAGKGDKRVTVQTGHEKSRFTVVLVCCANGTKLPPRLIFERKILPKDPFLSAVIVQANLKCCLDESMMGA